MIVCYVYINFNFEYKPVKINTSIWCCIPNENMAHFTKIKTTYLIVILYMYL